MTFSTILTIAAVIILVVVTAIISSRLTAMAMSTRGQKYKRREPALAAAEDAEDTERVGSGLGKIVVHRFPDDDTVREERYVDGGAGSLTCSTFAPRVAQPASKFIVTIWLHFTKDLAQVRELEAMIGERQLSGVAAGLELELDQSVDAVLEMEELRVSEPCAQFTWRGHPVNASFLVEVPEDVTGTVDGVVKLLHERVRFGTVRFSVHISPSGNAAEQGRLRAGVSFPSTAFASYSSTDRADVLARIQGIKKILPSLDVFLDAMSLRSGDDWRSVLQREIVGRDLFYLFWSSNAAKSEYVDWEWRLRKSAWGVKGIDPVPLQSPAACPPPKDLSSLHFSDPELPFIDSHQRK